MWLYTPLPATPASHLSWFCYEKKRKKKKKTTWLKLPTSSPPAWYPLGSPRESRHGLKWGEGPRVGTHPLSSSTRWKQKAAVREKQSPPGRGGGSPEMRRAQKQSERSVLTPKQRGSLFSLLYSPARRLRAKGEARGQTHVWPTWGTQSRTGWKASLHWKCSAIKGKPSYSGACNLNCSSL